MPIPVGEGKGRVDLLLLNGARHVVKNVVEPHTGLPVWDWLGEAVEEFIAENVPSEPVTAVRVARDLGVLKKKRYVRTSTNLG